MIDHFAKLIESVSQDANYKPNEKELQVATLQTKLDSLKTSYTDLVNAYTNWSNARINRNTTLYNPLTGLVQIALEVKEYVKSVLEQAAHNSNKLADLNFLT